MIPHNCDVYSLEEEASCSYDWDSDPDVLGDITSHEMCRFILDIRPRVESLL